MTASDKIVVGRSGFVTGLAWTFIALAGFSTIIGVLQNIMLALMFPTEDLHASMQQAETVQPMPAVFRFMFENFRLFFVAFLVLSVGTLVAAIGLLKRRNWVRLIFIGIMAFAIVWNLAGLAMPFIMTSLIPDVPVHAQSDFHDNFKLIWNIMIGFTVVIGVAFAALFGWIIKRLLAEDIRREFLAL